MPLGRSKRGLLWGCLGTAIIAALGGLLAVVSAVTLWRVRANTLAPADISQLVRHEVQDRARAMSQPVAVTSIQLEQSAFGQTKVFQGSCNRLRSIVNYSRLYFEKVLSTNWCDPFQPVWEVRLTSEWPARRAQQMNFYLIYSADGRLLYSYAATIP